jgi:hypothetical protein
MATPDEYMSIIVDGIYKGTCLVTQFQNVGLEVAV